MCRNLTLRQKLLPLYMKATNDQEVSAAPETVSAPPPTISASITPTMPPAAPDATASVMQAFRHPSLGRSHTRPLAQYAPTPLPGAAQESAAMPPAAMVPAPLAAAPAPAAPAAHPEPTPVRSFGLAGKGPRVVAGVSRPAAPRITKYSPPAATTPATAPATAPATPLAAAPAASPVPAPLAAPAATATTPIATQAAPETHTIPPAFAHMMSQQGAESAGPQATLPSQLIPPAGEKPLVKPKPAKP